MPLDDLKEKIYDPQDRLSAQRHEASPFDPEVSLKADASRFSQEKGFGKGEKGLNAEQKKIIRYGSLTLVGIILILAAVVAFVKIRQNAFRPERVSIAIEGSDSAGSNQESSFRLVYKNENRVALKDVKIFFNYSSNFTPGGSQGLQIDNPNNSHVTIGEIAPYSQGEYQLVGKFFAPVNAVVYLNAVLEFTPSNLSSRFRSESRLGVNIMTSPLKVEIEAPLDVISGKQIDYVINYQNLSPATFRNVRVRAEYPRDFNFVKADPSPAVEDNSWTIGDLAGGLKGKIIVSGNISGARNDSKLIKVAIEAENENGETVIYGEEYKSTKIIASPLYVSQLVNDKSTAALNAGDIIYYTVVFGNSGETGMRNAIIKMKIDSEVIDYANLKNIGGFYDSSTQTITWKAPEINELVNLEPGAKKTIRFPMRVLSQLPVKDREDKNFTVDTLVEIDSPDIPTPIRENKIISSNRLVLKVNTPVALDVLGYHKDANIENFGPIPPAVGQETSYVIHWKVTNPANDVADLEVSSFLPSGVKWTGKVFPEEEKGNIAFNERTNQISWKIGPLPSGTGILNSPREVSFQASIIPQINQVGQLVKILEPSVLTAKDLFTNQPIRIESPAKKTDLREDPTLEYGYTVAE